jgi:hypothetical protein
MTFLTDVADFNNEVLAEFGRPFAVHRPLRADVPLLSPLGSTLVYPYRNPKGHGDADWLIMINADLAEPGDYLVAGDEVYIYAQAPFLMPAQAIRCTGLIALQRSVQEGQSIGPQSYGGVSAAQAECVLGDVNNEGNLVTGWPASILIGGRQGAGAHLPMSVSNGGFQIMLPKTVPVIINASDVLIDDLGRRFIADTCELSDLGWRLTVKETHP